LRFAQKHVLSHPVSASGTIVAVCTANICRSPMAAALLQHALAAQPEPLRSLRVISAGVAARSGEPVSENSVVALKKVGIDIAQHRSQPLTQRMLDEALAVICMTESHRAMIEVQAEPVPPNVFLLREFLPGEGDKEIGDPYGGPLRVYEMARDEMVEAIPALVAHLKTLMPPPPAS
jgi:protein-tyrosine-phosphatase